MYFLGRARSIVLDVTDTPGMTPPAVSLTTPEIDAVDCAYAPDGSHTVKRVIVNAITQDITPQEPARDIRSSSRHPNRMPVSPRRLLRLASGR